MSHSPGPWRKRQRCNEPTEIYDANGVEIGFFYVFETPDQPIEQQQQANARLVVAAPDLLDALESLLTMERAMSSRISDEALAKLDATWQMKEARKALAKAKGETP